MQVYIFAVALFWNNRMETSLAKEIDSVLSPQIYANIFKEQRRQQQILTKDMTKYSYEKNHKLLLAGYTKIFELLEKNNSTLHYNNYSVYQEGFAESQPKQNAVTVIMENCCLSAEFLLHFPDISYRIFKNKSLAHWKQTFNWCIHFVNAFPHITDESTARLMELMRQEINHELRTVDYVNPYYAKEPKEVNADQVKRHKKSLKKLKKGPQLSSTRNEL